MPVRDSLRLLLLVAVGMAVAATPAAAAADLAGPPEYDPEIAGMLAAVSGTELLNTTSDLQDFSTRAFGTPGNREAGEYLYRRLGGIPGLTVEYRDGELRNVVATLPGRGPASDEIVVVGAHYDSTSPDPVRAPGAADNGCGVALVLELARAMSRHAFDRTIVFAFWNAEENGRHGSAAYVEDAVNASAPIVLYLNYDSACGGTGDRPTANLLYNRAARGTAALAVRHNALYGTNFTLTRKAGPYLSDHTSFWARGYPAIMVHVPPQRQAHTPEDTVEKVSFEYAEKNARLGLSVLAAAAGVWGAHPVAAPGAGGGVYDDREVRAVLPNGTVIHRAGGDGYARMVRLLSGCCPKALEDL